MAVAAPAVNLKQLDSVLDSSWREDRAARQRTLPARMVEGYALFLLLHLSNKVKRDLHDIRADNINGAALNTHNIAIVDRSAVSCGRIAGLQWLPHHNERQR